jgi:hypothetical protein
MKNLLIALLLLPFFAFAQKTDTTLFKGATKIIVHNSLTADENYKLAIQKLMDNDFFIEAKDSEYHTIKTQPKKVGKWTFSSFLNVRTKDNEIIFQGMFKTGIQLDMGGVVDPDNFQPIVYKDMGGYKMTFKDMETTALLFSMPLLYSN